MGHLDRNTPREERSLEVMIENQWASIREYAGVIRTATEVETVRDSAARVLSAVSKIKEYTFRLENNRMYQDILSRVENALDQKGGGTG